MDSINGLGLMDHQKPLGLLGNFVSIATILPIPENGRGLNGL
jgi:hypothetical protein